jgi:hypothetical protein
MNRICYSIVYVNEHGNARRTRYWSCNTLGGIKSIARREAQLQYGLKGYTILGFERLSYIRADHVVIEFYPTKEGKAYPRSIFP